jgi:hypothetical protein
MTVEPLAVVRHKSKNALATANQNSEFQEYLAKIGCSVTYDSNKHLVKNLSSKIKGGTDTDIEQKFASFHQPNIVYQSGANMMMMNNNNEPKKLLIKDEDLLAIKSTNEPPHQHISLVQNVYTPNVSTALHNEAQKNARQAANNENRRYELFELANRSLINNIKIVAAECQINNEKSKKAAAFRVSFFFYIKI